MLTGVEGANLWRGVEAHVRAFVEPLLYYAFGLGLQVETQVFDFVKHGGLAPAIGIVRSFHGGGFRVRRVQFCQRRAFVFGPFDIVFEQRRFGSRGRAFELAREEPPLRLSFEFAWDGFGIVGLSLVGP